MRIKKVNELNSSVESFLGAKINEEDTLNLLRLLSNMNENCKKFLDATPKKSVTCYLREGIANFTNIDTKMTLTVKINA